MLPEYRRPKIGSDERCELNGMSKNSDALQTQYFECLRHYDANGANGNHTAAIKIGRQFVTSGLETLDLARMHELALQELVLAQDTPVSRARIVKRAGRFFVFALTPIEATHRLQSKAMRTWIGAALNWRPPIES